MQSGIDYERIRALYYEKYVWGVSAVLGELRGALLGVRRGDGARSARGLAMS